MPNCHFCLRKVSGDILVDVVLHDGTCSKEPVCGSCFHDWVSGKEEYKAKARSHEVDL